MDESTLLTLATGPTSSLILLLGMGLAGWRFMTQTVVPAASRWVDSHLAQVDRLIDEHAADRNAWLAEMQECRETSTRIERKIGAVFGRLDSIAEKLP